MRTRSFRRPSRQTGAVLYVALIMLILLALIGIAAIQVANLQERMSANYVSSAMAFQNAEATAREREALISANVKAGELPALNVAPLAACTTPFDPATWANTAPHVRRIDKCYGSDAAVGVDESEATDQIYQITAFNTDRAGAPTAEAIVDTVFIP